jgi:hypothetical protein
MLRFRGRLQQVVQQRHGVTQAGSFDAFFVEEACPAAIRSRE